MAVYLVGKDGHSHYVMAHEVESYVSVGYNLYVEQTEIISDIDALIEQIAHDLNSGFHNVYMVKKDGVSLAIQPCRVKEFYDRGYDIYTTNITKIDDVDAEIAKINASEDILKLGELYGTN